MPTAAGFADVSVELVLTGFPRPAYITFGVDPTATDPSLIAASVAAAASVAGSLKSVLDATVTNTVIKVSLGTDGSGDISGEGNGFGSGGISLTALPPNCAVLVHKRTARGGRRGRGRFFLPWCVGETNVEENGSIQSSQVTTLQNAMNTFRAALVTEAVPMYLLHGPGQTPVGAPDQVTSLAVDSVIGTQRRRLGR
jgi:hypothetical protein